MHWFRRLSGSLCDAVTGQSGGKEMLAHSNRANLFLLPVGVQRHQEKDLQAGRSAEQICSRLAIESMKVRG
ncbi:MAG: hypothetical protein P1S60_20090 [Anaerolineae bacterium]|nr:hypothetical protein [Anaerolineae bacterium]